jgi:SAM-dependent methyltransferase
MLGAVGTPPGEPALLIRVRDRALHAYIQQHPFCTGPDEALNRACFRAVLDSIELRECRCRAALEIIDSAELSHATEIAAAASALLSAVGLGESTVRARLESRAWKMCFVPTDVESALALGCGEGDEIAALRARLPHARISALDWVNKLTPGLLGVARAEFDHGDFDTLLKQRVSAFDLVFSNHVLEHSYDPESLLKAAHGALKPSGRLVCALPLDGEAKNPLFQRVLLLTRDPRRIRRTDMFALAAGHPYKTNASDLTHTLLTVGFRSVRVAFRPWHPTLFETISADALDVARQQHFTLHRSTLGNLQAMVSGTFGQHPPLCTLRVLGAIESRLPFGIIRMHTHRSLEAVVIASK